MSAARHLIAAGLTLAAFFAATHMRTDADLWGHVRFGLDTLQTWSLPADDPYSFTQDTPWINHEWLSELQMGLVWTAGGTAGLALLYPALETGAVGGIVAVGMIATADAAAIPTAYRAGRAPEAGRLQERIAPLHQKIVAEMGVAGVKAALDLLGLYGGPPRPPLLPASNEMVSTVRSSLDAAGLRSAARP